MQHASLSIGWLSTVASVGYYFIIVLTSTLDSLGGVKEGSLHSNTSLHQKHAHAAKVRV